MKKVLIIGVLGYGISQLGFGLAQNAFLISELQQKVPIPAYTVPNPYASYGSYTGCGCGSY